MDDVKIRALFIKWQGEKRSCNRLLQINEKGAAQYKRDKHVSKVHTQRIYKHVLNSVSPQEDMSASLSLSVYHLLSIFLKNFISKCDRVVHCKPMILQRILEMLHNHRNHIFIGIENWKK